MRRTFPSLFRWLAIVLLVTFTNAALAMAAYVCPEQTVGARMMADMPCAGMDMEKPVHCAEHKAGTKAAPEQGGAPVLVPAALAFAIPLPRPRVAGTDVIAHAATPLDAGTDPPYLRTLRLRI
ncbi:hypothetical protein [Pseudoduganella flava]|nr:hypothetical protein [Pseudoduganella flava]QGZ42367.1 hypothetical protein GO485_27275 [Pseudoduganella flava]